MVYKGKPYQNDSKWMIWGYHYFWKDPYVVVDMFFFKKTDFTILSGVKAFQNVT